MARKTSDISDKYTTKSMDSIFCAFKLDISGENCQWFRYFKYKLKKILPAFIK